MSTPPDPCKCCKPRYIKFRLNDPITAADEFASANVELYWDGIPPDDAPDPPNPWVVDVYNLERQANEYVFSAAEDEVGYAIWDDVEDKYRIFYLPTAGSDVIVFELYDDLNVGGSAAAYKLVWNGAALVREGGPVITVHDFYSNPGMFQGYAGYLGIALRRSSGEEHYLIVWMEHKALFVNFELTENMQAGGPTDAAVNDYYQGRNPGTNIQIYDSNLLHLYALKGARGRAVWNWGEKRYETWACDQQCLLFRCQAYEDFDSSDANVTTKPDTFNRMTNSPFGQDPADENGDTTWPSTLVNTLKLAGKANDWLVATFDDSQDEWILLQVAPPLTYDVMSASLHLTGGHTTIGNVLPLSDFVSNDGDQTYFEFVSNPVYGIKVKKTGYYLIGASLGASYTTASGDNTCTGMGMRRFYSQLFYHNGLAAPNDVNTPIAYTSIAMGLFSICEYKHQQGGSISRVWSGAGGNVILNLKTTNESGGGSVEILGGRTNIWIQRLQIET